MLAHEWVVHLIVFVAIIIAVDAKGLKGKGIGRRGRNRGEHRNHKLNKHESTGVSQLGSLPRCVPSYLEVTKAQKLVYQKRPRLAAKRLGNARNIDVETSQYVGEIRALPTVPIKDLREFVANLNGIELRAVPVLHVTVHKPAGDFGLREIRD